MELARAAAAEGPPLLVAAGGDGTVNAVAAELVGRPTVLGVLPLGTLNHFAKDLGIPTDLERAVRALRDGSVARIDVGEVNGRIFLNNSSLGLYPDIVRQREHQQERLGRGKWHAMAWAFLGALKRYPFMNVRLEADGEVFARRTPFVFIGNNEYRMEALQIGARACLDRGLLSLYVAHRTGRLGLLRLAVRALFGRLSQASDFDSVCAREILVETRRPRVRVATDGEVTIMQSPLRYRVRPGALRVAVPAGEPSG
jgi:diacylglycerol kinase family enzyme